MKIASRTIRRMRQAAAMAIGTQGIFRGVATGVGARVLSALRVSPLRLPPPLLAAPAASARLSSPLPLREAASRGFFSYNVLEGAEVAAAAPARVARFRLAGTV